MSDVQPMIYVETLDHAIAFYRDRLGFEVEIFGHHPETGKPLVASASLDGATLLLTSEVLFRDGNPGEGGNVRLYFHLRDSVDDLHARIASHPYVSIVQGPTDQHWGDRTVIIRDPWGTLLVFSNRGGEL